MDPQGFTSTTTPESLTLALEQFHMFQISESNFVPERHQFDPSKEKTLFFEIPIPEDDVDGPKTRKFLALITVLLSKNMTWEKVRPFSDILQDVKIKFTPQQGKLSSLRNINKISECFNTEKSIYFILRDNFTDIPNIEDISSKTIIGLITQLDKLSTIKPALGTCTAYNNKGFPLLNHPFGVPNLWESYHIRSKIGSTQEQKLLDEFFSQQSILRLLTPEALAKHIPSKREKFLSNKTMKQYCDEVLRLERLECHEMALGTPMGEEKEFFETINIRRAVLVDIYTHQLLEELCEKVLKIEPEQCPIFKQLTYGHAMARMTVLKNLTNLLPGACRYKLFSNDFKNISTQLTKYYSQNMPSQLLFQKQSTQSTQHPQSVTTDFKLPPNFTLKFINNG